MHKIESAFWEELAKIGWLGTYYHGTSSENEKKILREGLKASKNVYGPGAVYLTPSKSHARTYKQMMMPEMVPTGKGPVIPRIREAARKIYETATAQPLEVRGVSKKMVKDPENPLLGKMIFGDIPPGKIRRGTSRLAKVRRFLAKRGL